MTLLADISSGNTGFADVMFLVGFILFLIAVLLYWPSDRPAYAPVALAAGLAAIALGWLVL